MSTPPEAVKPLKLMEYLCILTKTPTGGIVLDPFAGSGSTLIAAKNTGRDFIGIEKELEYVKIAEARIANVKIKQTLF
jgi:site-specific DNA-methyltransferase (adenine-specific)